METDSSRQPRPREYIYVVLYVSSGGLRYATFHLGDRHLTRSTTDGFLVIAKEDFNFLQYMAGNRLYTWAYDSGFCFISTVLYRLEEEVAPPVSTEYMITLHHTVVGEAVMIMDSVMDCEPQEGQLEFTPNVWGLWR